MPDQTPQATFPLDPDDYDIGSNGAVIPRDPVTPPEPRPLEHATYQCLDCGAVGRIGTPAAEVGQPGLDVERLAEVAYRDRPPTGSRPVPWTPVKRREWRAWAGRIEAALREPRS